MNAQRVPKRRRQRGMTLVEMTVSLAAMTVVLAGAMAIMISSRGALAVNGNRSSLQETGRRILNDVLLDLRRSGISVANLPAVFERPIAPEALSQRGALVGSMNFADAALVSNVIATGQAVQNRITRNLNRVTNEVVFQVPRDLDGDGRPIDAAGTLEWGPETLSYRVIQEPNGINWLYRYTEVGGAVTARDRVGPFVQNITFDVIVNDPSLGYNEIAVVVYMQRRNERGQIISASLEGSVLLRNTREL